MKKSYLFDACGALAIFLFSLMFQTFNMGSLSLGSFLGFAIGSLAVGLARIKFFEQPEIFSSLIEWMVIISVSLIFIHVFPIEIRDFGDFFMPYFNMSINGFIYLFIILLFSFSRLNEKKDERTLR